jgi:hypothetical protein
MKNLLLLGVGGVKYLLDKWGELYSLSILPTPGFRDTCEISYCSPFFVIGGKINFHGAPEPECAPAPEIKLICCVAVP